MFVTSILADAAQVQSGKLYILGGGIDQIPAAHPFALTLIFHVGWDETNKRHHVLVSLTNADGAQVHLPTPTGNAPFEVRSEFEVGRPPGIPPGSTMYVPTVVMLGGGIPLQPGRYQFHIQVDGSESREWDRAFSITPAVPVG
jgi:hypothetical protein